MADTLALGASGRNPMRVQVSPAAHSSYNEDSYGSLQSIFYCEAQKYMNTSSPFSKHNPLKIFVLFSGEASSIRHLRHSSVEYGYLYQIVGALSSNANAPGIQFFKNHTNHREKFTPKFESAKDMSEEHIPCDILDWGTFQENIPQNKWRQCLNKLIQIIFNSRERRRKRYFKQVLEIIEKYEVDLILCAGFKIIIPDFFIQECKIPIINDHPADLTILNADGTRRYAGSGLDAIARAIQDGKETICSTVHFVEIGPVDSGRIICQSLPARLEPNADPETIRKRIKWICSGQAIDDALRRITRGEVLLPKNTDFTEALLT